MIYENDIEIRYPYWSSSKVQIVTQTLDILQECYHSIAHYQQT